METRNLEMANGDGTELRKRNVGKTSPVLTEPEKVLNSGDLTSDSENKKTAVLETEQSITEDSECQNQQNCQTDEDTPNSNAIGDVKTTWKERFLGKVENFVTRGSRKTGFYRIHPNTAKKLYFDILRDEQNGIRDKLQKKVNRERRKDKSGRELEENSAEDVEKSRKLEIFFISITAIVILTLYPIALYIALTKQSKK